MSDSETGWSTGTGDDVAGRLLVVYPDLRSAADSDTRSAEEKLDEAVQLAAALPVNIAGERIVSLRQVRPSTYIGQGHIDDLREDIEANHVDVVVMNCALSPVQQRNLENALNAKVLDRTALILEIFGQRARTREGVLQVTLAHLNFQRSRLVRSWTHLERQRGGGGFMGGPGETQIESDRRMIADRIAVLERQLKQVRRTRAEHRKQRQKAPFPVVALVGYTNAGKSTLFNRLTGAAVTAKDMLFATLDPTLRAIDLENGSKVILSDTVGFIADLPTQLIAAFRATLEEVLEADIILHVRDIAHPEAEAQAADVKHVLFELGIDLDDADTQDAVIEVHNKADLLTPEESDDLRHSAQRRGQKCVSISALTGAGLSDLSFAIETWIARQDFEVQLWLPYSEGRARAQLAAHCDILDQTPEGEGTSYRVSADAIGWGRFEKALRA